MPGIPVRTVSKGGLPVVSVARGKGITVTESDRGVPVTIAANGFGLPVYFENSSPPIDFDFQEFNLTAGQEGQWVGFSTGAPTTPQPAFGSISGQPTAVTNLLAFYDDTASGVFLAVFSGDYVDELQGLELTIGGFVVDSFEVQLISGNTWVRFTGIPGDLTPGAVYEVEFGWDFSVPAPAFATQPSISGSLQVGQVLTGTDGTGTNYTTYSRQWLRGTTAISGATGATYTTTNDDVGFAISRRDTLTGTTAPPAVTTTNAIGPITAAQELWTPDDLPAMYKTNGGMWDAANSQIAGTNQVSAVTDSWGVRDMQQATSANQPFSGTRNSFPAVVWPDTTGSRWVGVSAAFQPKYYVEVSQFQTGTEATADAGITHIIGGDSDALTSRVRIRQGASGFTNPADGDFVAAKNGATAFSVNVLPLPMSIMEITGSFGSTPWGAGRSSIVLRSWRGPKLWWMFLGEVPTLDLRQRIQGYLAWRYNLVAELPADHPYKSAPPTKAS